MLAVGLLVLERNHPPALVDAFDVSAILFDLSSFLTLAVGVVVALTTVRRLSVELRRAEGQSNTGRFERLRRAREVRLRAAWLLLVATVLIVLGLTLIAIPEIALAH